MAERTIMVCDVCGEQATETVTLQVGARKLLKDLCRVHVAELVQGARRPKRGRRPGSTSAIRPARARSQGKRVAGKGRSAKATSTARRTGRRTAVKASNVTS